MNPWPRRLCWNCVEDPVLRGWVKKQGTNSLCSFCGKRRRSVTLHQFAERIDPVIRSYYEPSDATPHVVDDDDDPVYWQDGQTASEIIRDNAGVIDDVARATDRILGLWEMRNVHDGDDAYYGETILEHVGTYAGELWERWESFQRRLLHEMRFFDESGRKTLDELFGDLATIGDGKAIVELPLGDEATFFRARIVNRSDVSTIRADPGKHIGPPPPWKARQGRMNAAGIQVFYGAFAEAVALAETRPPVGATVVVAKFAAVRPLRLLDLTFLPVAYHDESLFSPNYDDTRSRVKFLRHLHRRISKPVLPDDELLGYLPTQAVATYVQHVLKFDGIIYGSIQIGANLDAHEQIPREQCNVVLFGDAAVVQTVEDRLEDDLGFADELNNPPRKPASLLSDGELKIVEVSSVAVQTQEIFDLPFEDDYE